MCEGSGTLFNTPGRPDWAQACSLAGNMGCMRGRPFSRRLEVWCSRQSCHCSCAGLRNGAFFLEPRPFFFTHVMGVSAYMLGRSILMKAVGMWHWEVHFCASRCTSLRNIPVFLTTANWSLLRPEPSILALHTCLSVHMADMSMRMLAAIEHIAGMWHWEGNLSSASFTLQRLWCQA